MEARKLLYSAMAVAPAVLMAGIGVHARTYADPFEWPAVQEDHARISAYVPLVVETFDRLQEANPQDTEAARTLAFKWIEGGQKGNLRPLVPTVLDESAVSGKKATIFDANQFVAKRLLHVAENKIESKQYELAAEDLILAVKVVECLQYSSFVSLYRSNLLHFSVLRRIEAVYPEVDLAKQKQLAACMNSMINDDGKVQKISAHARRMAQMEAERYRQIHALEQDPEKTDASNAFFEHPALAKASGVSGHGDSELSLQGLSFEAKQCMLTDQRNRLMIDRIMSLPSRLVP